jgi:hypothetical protein
MDGSNRLLAAQRARMRTGRGMLCSAATVLLVVAGAASSNNPGRSLLALAILSPLIWGGASTFENLQLLCAGCNHGEGRALGASSVNIATSSGPSCGSGTCAALEKVAMSGADRSGEVGFRF